MVGIHMKNWEEIEGWFSPAEGAALRELAVEKICVEVGSYKGRSTVCMAQVAQHVHAVDYFRSHVNGQCQMDTYTTLDEFKANTEGLPVTIWIGSSLHACRNFGADSVDLVFIDALHTYEAVRSDILAWWKILRMGGIMCFHDYNWPPQDQFPGGPTQAVNETFKDVHWGAGSFVWGMKNKECLIWEKQ